MRHFIRHGYGYPDPSARVCAVGKIRCGTRYHHADCRFLRRQGADGLQVFYSEVVVCTLEEARRAGLSACSICIDALEEAGRA